jgi:hypothetical protein
MSEIFHMSQKLCPLTLEELGQSKSAAAPPNQEKGAPPANGYSGWIYKKGRVNTAFQRRWLVLKGGMLSYYLARPLTDSEKPQGSFLVEQCNLEEEYGNHVDVGFQFSLKVTTRQYVFAAPTLNERTRWLMAIKSAKGVLPVAMNPDEDPESHGKEIHPSVSVMPELQSSDLSPEIVTLELRKRVLPSEFRHGSPASANGHEDSSPAVPAKRDREGGLSPAVGPIRVNEEECSTEHQKFTWIINK